MTDLEGNWESYRVFTAPVNWVFESGERLEINFVQYDNESRSFGTNTRLRWTFDPFGELFVVYNHNVTDFGDRWGRDSNQLLVKAQHAVRR